MPFLHFVSSSIWLSNVQGPPLRILSRSNSVLNLNWKRFEPTSTICTSFSKPQAFFNVVFAAFLLKVLHVRNLPIKHSEQLSISSLLPSSAICIVSSSSTVSFIFSNPATTSSAIVTNTHTPVGHENRNFKGKKPTNTLGLA